MLATGQCFSCHSPPMACCIILTARAREKHNRVRKKQQNKKEATESRRSITEQEAQHAIIVARRAAPAYHPDHRTLALATSARSVRTTNSFSTGTACADSKMLWGT